MNGYHGAESRDETGGEVSKNPSEGPSREPNCSQHIPVRYHGDSGLLLTAKHGNSVRERMLLVTGEPRVAWMRIPNARGKCGLGGSKGGSIYATRRTGA